MQRVKYISPILALAVLFLSSCVDRITIPPEEAISLVFNCEMIRGNSMIVATCSTANNLNGTEPIEKPENAIIKLFIGNDTPFRFQYDPDTKKYFLRNANDVFRFRRSDFKITAELPESELPAIEATSPLPRPNSVVSMTSSKLDTVTVDGQLFYQRDIKYVLKEPTIKPAFYHLMTEENLSTVVETSTDTVYTKLGKKAHVEYNRVIYSGSGMVILAHRAGILIDQSRLEDNTFVVRVVSSFPISEENQSFDLFNTTLYSVTEDYYRHHRSRSKIMESTGENLSDPVISKSNIKGGFGHFSAMTQVKQSYTIH